MEKKKTEINLHEVIDYKNILIKSANGKSELRIKHNKYDYETERNIETDTIIGIKTE